MSRIKTYQLYASMNATASAAANVVIRRDCEVIAVNFSAALDMIADNSTSRVALSVNPTSQIGVNDAMGSLGEVDLSGNLVTSGFLAGGVNGQWIMPGVPLRTNDVLYMHCLITTCTTQCTFIIFVREK